jgi:hypothetical protein
MTEVVLQLGVRMELTILQYKKYMLGTVYKNLRLGQILWINDLSKTCNIEMGFWTWNVRGLHI